MVECGEICFLDVQGNIASVLVCLFVCLFVVCCESSNGPLAALTVSSRS